MISGFFCLSDVGLKRAENQDAWSADPAGGFFLVSDGMGGLNAGGVAAKAVAEVLPRMLAQNIGALPKRTDRAVREAVKETVAQFSASLRERAKGNPALSGMGATLALVLHQGGRVHIAHVGDSRVYLLARGRLRRLTRDHNIVAVMLALGKITKEEAAVHPSRHALSRYVGMGGRAAADARTIRPKTEGRLLLCTDGLTGMLDDEKIRAALEQEAEPASACLRLVAEAKAAGGLDNVTAMVVDVGPGE